MEELLESWLGREFIDNHKDKLDKSLLAGLVCFTHFSKKLDGLLAEHAKPDFLGRCAAGQFKDNTPGFDLFLVILLKNGKITYILIQVKNTIVKQLILKQEGKNEWFEYEWASVSLRNDYLAILMNLGVQNDNIDKIEDLCIAQESPRLARKCHEQNPYATKAISAENEVNQRYRFVINGLDETVYPCLSKEVAECLRKMANCNRDEFSKLTQSVRHSVCQDNYHTEIGKY